RGTNAGSLPKRGTNAGSPPTEGPGVGVVAAARSHGTPNTSNCPRASIFPVTADDPIAEELVGRRQGSSRNHELCLAGIGPDELQSEVVILEQFAAQIAHALFLGKRALGDLL